MALYRLYVTHDSIGIFENVTATKVTIGFKCTDCKNVVKFTVYPKKCEIEAGDNLKMCRCQKLVDLKVMSSEDQSVAAILHVRAPFIIAEKEIFDDDIVWHGNTREHCFDLKFSTEGKYFSMSNSVNNPLPLERPINLNMKEDGSDLTFSTEGKSSSMSSSVYNPLPLECPINLVGEAGPSNWAAGYFSGMSKRSPSPDISPEIPYRSPNRKRQLGGGADHCSSSEHSHESGSSEETERYNRSESDDIEDIQKDIEAEAEYGSDSEEGVYETHVVEDEDEEEGAAAGVHVNKENPAAVEEEAAAGGELVGSVAVALEDHKPAGEDEGVVAGVHVEESPDVHGLFLEVYRVA